MARIDELFPADPLAVGAPVGGTPAVGAVGVSPTPPVAPALLPAAPSVSELCQEPFTYLSGPAGTGKTFLARQIIEERQDAVLCATTGIAAVNLGDATTINALLQYFDTQSLLESYASGRLQTRLRQLRRSGVRILVLDEVSMLDADQLTVLCQALDEVNITKTYDASLGEVSYETDDDQEMKLLLCGDFGQLPPVEAAFAFESPEWHRFRSRTFTLTTVHRQGDLEFVRALQAVRRGRPRDAVGLLETRMVQTLDFEFPGTTIVAKNDEVDRINGLRHAKLPGTPLTWKTIRSGEQLKDWLRLIPEETSVKPGALVMILANKTYPRADDEPIGDYMYVNGDLGTVVDRHVGGIRVKLQRTGQEQIVTPVVREWKIPTGLKKTPYTIKGTISYLPLRLAFASTTHKSQGLSLDQVQVNLASWMFSRPGMTYVALSRCRSLEGLRIVGNQKMFLGKCAVDPKIQEFL